MSARKRRLVLTPPADADLRDILAYTLREWGRAQRNAYRAIMMQRLKRLTDHPLLGPAREDVFPGCRSLTIEQHIAYYRPTETQIVVARILHVRRDPIGIVEVPD